MSEFEQECEQAFKKQTQEGVTGIDWNCWKCQAHLQRLLDTDGPLVNLIRANLDQHIKSGKHEHV